MVSRQELYEQIKRTSKDAYILSEMKRLGYWQDDQPQLTRELVEAKAAIQQELATLGRQLKDPAAALREVHTRRMAEARARRVETRVKGEAARYQRAIARHQLRQSRITSLGDAARFGSESAPNPAQLQAQGLPELATALELATAMGVSLNELRFLTYSRRVSKISHYQRFEMAKKTGGTRLISAPMPRLKRLQYWILDHLLAPLAISAQAHGFAPGRSTLTNARPHAHQRVLINLDLQDFFPTLSYPRIKGLFQQLGYGDEVATLLSLICTEAETQEVELDGERYFIAGPQRRLPQGAPTSPALSNLICRRLDRRLLGLAQKLGFVYTRYADDLSFSGPESRNVEALLRGVATIVGDEGFTVHPAKTRVMRKGRRMEVTGLVVNAGVGISRQTLKKFRALLHQLALNGPEGKTWGESPATGAALFRRIEGFARYVAMVHPDKGRAFLAEIAALRQKFGLPAYRRPASTFRRLSAAGQLPLPRQRVAVPPPMPQLAETLEIRELEAQVRQHLGLPPGASAQDPTSAAGKETAK